MASGPTVRSLARTLGLSRSTVSCALRGSGRIAPATVERVRKAAEKASYRHNPLASTLMSELRRSRHGRFRGVIAVIDLHEPERPAHGPFHEQLLLGAETRGKALGFKIERYVAHQRGLTLARIDTILRSRGIHGVMLLPSWESPDFSALQWDRYAGVYADYNRMTPPLHAVCSDHYQSTRLALETVRTLGYRRPGIFMERGRNERLEGRYTAALSGFYGDDPRELPVPPLLTEALSRSAFEKWFRRYQPDVVLCHFTDALEWMEACGAKVPETHGFVSLNLVNQTRPCAGLDFQPELIGGRAIEVIIAQLQRNERGIPPVPTRATLPCRWIDGPTVRALE